MVVRDIPDRERGCLEEFLLALAELVTDVRDLKLDRLGGVVQPRFLSGHLLADRDDEGIGTLKVPGLSPKAIRNGDVVILSGTAGDHGTAVMLARSGMMQGTLQSDCAPLNGLCNAIFAAGGAVRVLRDPTRGGVATTLNEFVEGSDLGIMLEESAVPVRKEVRAACDMLGLDPLYCANEGKLLCVAAPEDTGKILSAMQEMPEGKNAAVIGTVTDRYPGRVVMKTAFGGSRVLQKLSGAQLPRIC